MKPKKIFKANKYITIKLEQDDSVIYVCGKRFLLCKHLLFTGTKETLSIKTKTLNSIDEIAQVLTPTSNNDIKINPEELYMGHCSNIQAWCQNDYDTRLLHNNLAFPLLMELTKNGDKLAQKVYMSELLTRFDEGNQTVQRAIKKYIKMLDKGKFIEVLREKERKSLLEFERDLGISFKLCPISDLIENSFAFSKGKIIQLYINKTSNFNTSFLPQSLKKLKNLKALYIDGINLEKIPMWIGNLEKLEILVIKNTKIKRLPKTFSKLLHLETLIIEDNELESIERIKEMPKIKRVFASNNLIQEISDQIMKMETLEELNVTNNPIKIKRKNKKIKIRQ